MSDTDAVVDVIYDSSGKRRVILFCRPSGTYAFTEERLSVDEFGEAWCPLGRCVGFYESLATARQEVIGNVWWLAAEREPG